MTPRVFNFSFRTGEVSIDYSKCARCKNYACIKADSLFGTGLLRLQAGKPVLTTNLEDAKRLCSECLACELYCKAYGNAGLSIKLDMLGLDEYRSRLKTCNKGG
jgi:Pyruvate/2-oxoacid:ferredoxin oxidoreductase delta subunit